MLVSPSHAFGGAHDDAMSSSKASSRPRQSPAARSTSGSAAAGSGTDSLRPAPASDGPQNSRWLTNARTSYSVHGVLLASWSSVMVRATAAMASAEWEMCDMAATLGGVGRKGIEQRRHTLRRVGRGLPNRRADAQYMQMPRPRSVGARRPARSKRREVDVGALLAVGHQVRAAGEQRPECANGAAQHAMRAGAVQEQEQRRAALGERVRIRCFTHEPTLGSSLAFLRRTPWARAKVERIWLEMVAHRAFKKMTGKRKPT